MLRKCLTSILVATCLVTALALVASPAPRAHAAPEPVQRIDGVDPGAGLLPMLGDLIRDVLGLVPASAASCNSEDPCAPDACYPEFCPCDSDPCAENACNPDACDGEGGGGTSGIDPIG